MSFLRKENIELQQHFEKLTNIKPTSSVIRIEDLKSKSPLNALVKDLQDKVDKQRLIINELKEIIKTKDEEIAKLRFKISESKKKLKKKRKEK